MRRLPMRKIKDVLRLHGAGLSARRIAAGVGLGRSTVAEYLRRAEVAELVRPLADGLEDEARERLLFPPLPAPKERQLTEPGWAAIHRDLRRPGVTLSLSWEECRGAHANDGYGCSAFCEHCRRWTGRPRLRVMRQHHVAGERMFVDCSGVRMSVVRDRPPVRRARWRFLSLCSAPRT